MMMKTVILNDDHGVGDSEWDLDDEIDEEESGHILKNTEKGLEKKRSS
jgi:hypothetical protein